MLFVDLHFNENRFEKVSLSLNEWGSKCTLSLVIERASDLMFFTHILHNSINIDFTYKIE
jgi:hypothetical protein